MAKTARTNKRDLPRKTCVSCNRPFAWRRKWAACWDEVRYCSQRCRKHRPPGAIWSMPDRST